MSLTNKQIKLLRKRSHRIQPIFQVGKHGMTETLLNELMAAIEKRELIKVQLLQNTMETPDEVAAYIESQTAVQVVQVIGNVLILYKPSTDTSNRRLSNEVRALR